MNKPQSAVRSSPTNNRDYMSELVRGCLSEQHLHFPQGESEKRYLLGRLHMNGEGVPQDLPMARYLFWQVYENNKNQTDNCPQHVAFSAYYLAKLTFQAAENALDIKLAENYLQFASNNNCTEARIELACRLLAGNQMTMDPERAVNVLHALHEGKIEIGTYMLGRCYLKGLGVERDLEKARGCMELAVKSSNAEISNNAARFLRELQ